MKIAIAQQDGTITQKLTDCHAFMVIEFDAKRNPTSRALVEVGAGSIALLTFAGKAEIDVLICGEMGIGSRNALESLGVILVPGAQGDATQAAVDFLCGALRGDQAFLDAQREEDPNDPMSCMHDCAKCGGCGTSAIPNLADLQNLPSVN